MVGAAAVGFGSALPASMPQDQLWEQFFAEHYRGVAFARRIWDGAGVRNRHGVADPRSEDLSNWGTDARMRRFLAEALPLGKEALSACLADAGVRAADVGVLAVASCTGYATPGLDTFLARDLGMDPSVQRLHIGHMGCYAAVPGLATVADAAAARGKLAVLLCVELTSLHLQPPGDDLDQVDQIVSHALFSDAAAAVAVAPEPAAGRALAAAGLPRLEVVDVVARTDTARADMMTWDVTDAGFRMGLSPRVPDVLAEHVQAVVGELLDGRGLGVGEVAAWAVHPGGPRIVDVVGDRLGLDDAPLGVSRAVLRDHGNCSSATVLLILERLRAAGGLDDGAHVVALAFGPGLTLYGSLLRVRG